MRAVIQRVKSSRVEVDGRVVGEIGMGLLVLLGVGKGDTEADASYMASKVINLRIFEDAEGKMNLSIKETGGSILVISQFTLYGDCRKGRRPSFIDAAEPAQADSLYSYFVEELKREGVETAKGIFGAMMDVHLVNWGPVTILLDSKKLF